MTERRMNRLTAGEGGVMGAHSLRTKDEFSIAMLHGGYSRAFREAAWRRRRQAALPPQAPPPELIAAPRPERTWRLPCAPVLPPQPIAGTPDKVWAEFREWLATDPQPTKRGVQSIIFEAAERWHVLPSQIKGDRRTALIVAIRQIAMARAYVERPDLSTTCIGRKFGGRDHTTVLHAVRKAGVHRGSHGA